MNKKNDLHKIASQILSKDLTDSFTREELIHFLLDSTVTLSLKEEKTTFGQRLADGLARVAGSWAFILSFTLFLLLWIMVNILLIQKAFDPYPFILLNLMLSCLAALQAPIIMMSQNRQAEKDRKQSESDYKTNLKAEIILEDLHYKLDEMAKNQRVLLEKVLALQKEDLD